ncbi:putative disease resistance protein [Acorus gramineus]|uniref:Disease resistance protein n=1 Tax=Acorus gramineus TaxID=55184 RepID=A0AAV9BF39_ACOGR|nr:putative disease resistance protein [Acorus gramineus]
MVPFGSNETPFDEWGVTRTVRSVVHCFHAIVRSRSFITRCIPSNGTPWCAYRLCTLRTRREIGMKIRKLNKRIKEIADSTPKFDIKNIKDEGSTSRVLEPHGPYPLVLPDEKDIIGLDEQVKEIMGQLIDGDRKRCMISVFGMAGLGKTTLARKVYTRVKTSMHFDCFAWITVSNEYNQKELLKEMVEEIMEKNSAKELLESNFSEKRMASELSEYLKKKKYFIVLDDVWKVEFWDTMQYIFPDVNNGSSMLITTRFNDVADFVIPNSPPIEMKFPSAEECLEILLKKAGLEDVSSCPAQLLDPAKQIVERCGRLPLALVVSGGILTTRSKIATEWWKNIQQLSNLQTLAIASIRDEDIRQLRNLRHLVVFKDCDISPNALSEAKDLQTLGGLHAGDWIRSLPSLTNLRVLSILRCRESHKELLAGSLIKLKLLVGLHLEGDGGFPSLCTLSSLDHLLALAITAAGDSICKLNGPAPKSVEDLPPNLSRLSIYGCEPMHYPIEIDDYEVWHMKHGDFPHLQVLEIVFVNRLQEWIVDKGALPRLRTLSVKYCGTLKMLPDGLRHVSTLQQLSIRCSTLLQRRVERDTGEDWDKIKHVPLIE